MNSSSEFINLNHLAPKPARSDYGIGAVGAGFIMRDVQLVAYAQAGFPVLGITSRTPEIAREAAEARGIPNVYDSLEQMLENPAIQILDVAVPPHKQPEIVEIAIQRGKHLKGVLAQKPLAVNHAEARKLVDACRKGGLTLAVNQNMRYDQSIRALKTLLDRGEFGTPVLATIEMRAVPHWQKWLPDYGRLTLLNMSIHHLDTFRYLFGNPDSIYVSARQDPRTEFAHRDGICLYILEFENGMRAAGWDDVWAGPRENLEPYIKWRVEGTEGIAEGTIGWPHYPNRTPSTIRFSSKQTGGAWIAPKWNEVWFPDAFQGPMGELMTAIATGTDPAINGEDNLHTVALVDAAYKSLEERRPVRVAEILA